MKRMRGVVLLALTLAAAGGAALLRAQSVPTLVNFQGRLTDASNNPLTGNHNFIFSLYTASGGGSLLWTETQSNVPVANGVFAVQLGASNALSPDLYAASAVYLEVSVDGVTLTPRERLVSSGYAFNADRLQGAGAASFVSTGAVTQQIAGAKTFTGSVTLPAALSLTGQAGDPAGAAGAIYFNSATNKLRVHIGSGFVDIATGTAGSGGGTVTSAVPPQYIDLSTVTTALAGKIGAGTNIPPQNVDLSTVTTALSGKMALGAVSPQYVDLSTVTTALNAKMGLGAVAPQYIDLSTVTTALGGKLSLTGDAMSGDLQIGAQYASTFSAAGYLTLANLAAAPAASVGRVYYDAASRKLRVSTGTAASQWVDLSTGGAGGLSTIVSEVAQFSGDGSAGNKLTLLSSSVTLQGNVFNAANRLVQLNASGDLQVGAQYASTLAAGGYLALAGNMTVPPSGGRGRVYFDPNGDGALKISLDGVSYVPISTGSAAGGIANVAADATQFSGDGTSGNALLLKSSSVTLQGNSFNGASQLVMLDSSGRLPALNASLLTNLPAASGPIAPQYVDLSTVTTALNLKLTSGAVPSAFIDLSTVTTALSGKMALGAVAPQYIDLSTVTTALAGKIGTGTNIPPQNVDLSTVTTALSGKMALGAVAPQYVNLSTVSASLSDLYLTKRSTGVAIEPGAVDLSTVTTALGGKLSIAGGALSGDLQVGAQYASTFSAAGYLTLANLAAAPAGAVGRIYYDSASNKLRLSTGAAVSQWVDLSTGGAGGLSTIVSEVAQFSGDGSAGNKLTLLSSSVTLQGNVFNAANKLVQLNASGDLQVGTQYASTISANGYVGLPNRATPPAGGRGRIYFDPTGDGALRISLDGASYVPISTGSAAGGIANVASDATQFSGDGTSGNALTLKSSSVTLQGNVFNAANKLVQLNASGDLQVGSQYASTMAAAGYLTLANLAAAPAGAVGRIYYDSASNKLRLSTGAAVSQWVDLSTGGAGGLSTIVSEVAQFSGDGSAGNKLTLLSSSVTLQGNVFNAANKLVQLNASGDLQVGSQYASTMAAAGYLTLANLAAAPAGAVGRIYYDSASNKLRLSTGAAVSQWVDLSTGGAGLSSIVSEVAQFSGDGSAGNKLTLLSSSVTLQGNSFNGASQLVKLDAAGDLQVGSQYASTMAAAGYLTLANLAAAPAGAVGRIYYDSASNKLRLSTGAAVSQWVDLSTGGAGGLSTIVSEVAQFSGDGSAGNKLTLLSSSVTLQGNSFNGASQLVKLDAAGALPALSMNGSFNLMGASTLTVFGKDAFGYSLRLSSGLDMSSGTLLAKLFVGSGAGLTDIYASSVPASGVLAGALGSAVIASSVAAGAIGSLQIAASTVTSANLASDAGSLFKVTAGTMAVLGGYVGINTAAPTAALDVRQAGGTAFQIDVSSPGYVSLRIGGVEVARIKP